MPELFPFATGFGRLSLKRVLFFLTALVFLTGCLEPLELRLVIRPDGSWSAAGEVTYARPSTASSGWPQELGRSVEKTVRSLVKHPSLRPQVTQERISPEKIRFRVSLEGLQTGDLLSLISERQVVAQWLLGTGSLAFKGDFQAGQTLEVDLPSNPSTGFTWSIAPGEEAGRVQMESSEERPVSAGLGGLARQRIRLRITQTGPEGPRLLYHRPWEGPGAVRRVITLEGRIADWKALTQSLAAGLAGDPNGIRTLRESPLAASPGAVRYPEAPALPSAFNWCDRNGCTPVKNQGGCGSCWAFATVAPLEANIRIHQGTVVDLSEQYLLSCNTDGWDCLYGGWWAHDYHQWKTVPGDTQAGAVMESLFPYTAHRTPCGAPYAHAYRIRDWAYVDEVNPFRVSGVEAIKRALYTYGPVAAAICVGNGFRQYTGGISSVDDSPFCGTGEVNHGITLVGWNDSPGYWILKNSWGDDWGEGGYMRLLYGRSNVGYAANYVMYSLGNTANKIYLPFLSAPVLPQDCLLANGDFELGAAGWTEYSNRRPSVILPVSDLPQTPHSGSRAAYLLKENDETAYIERTSLTVPPACSWLGLWYWFNSSETACDKDLATILVNETVVDTFGLCQATQTGAWQKRYVDLSGFAGQTVSLRVQAKSNASSTSQFLIDDLSLEFFPFP